MKKWIAALVASLAVLASPAFAQKADILETISITGEINSGTSEQVSKQVDQINENSKVKAVILVLDTPGGGATASAQIYEDLSRIKVPVVAYCQSMCASGGVYSMVAPSIKFIAIRTETVTGSVGVIMHSMRYNRLLEWAHIDAETYRSGNLKDAGNPTRAREAAEQAYLQSIIDGLAKNFYAVVAKARPKITDWDAIKSARVFIGKDAVDVGLVDAIMSREEVEKKAKDLSGSKNIFTRDELKKMSAAADTPTTYHTALPEPRSAFGDVPWLIETAKEILSGQTVKIEYRLPYRM
jgi:protease-4